MLMLSYEKHLVDLNLGVLELKILALLRHLLHRISKISTQSK